VLPNMEAVRGGKYLLGELNYLYLKLRDDEDFPATAAVKGAGAIEPGAALAAFLPHGACTVADTPVAGAEWKHWAASGTTGQQHLTRGFGRTSGMTGRMPRLGLAFSSTVNGHHGGSNDETTAMQGAQSCITASVETSNSNSRRANPGFVVVFAYSPREIPVLEGFALKLVFRYSFIARQPF